MLNTIKLDRKGRSADEILGELNKTIGGYGVEAIRREGEWDPYWGDAVALYVNMGDTYTETVLYAIDEDRFLHCSPGDYIEGLDVNE